MPEFALHHRLAADCVNVGDWPLCRVLLMNDARYPWFILVPRLAGLRELCELSEHYAAQYTQESRWLSAYLLQQHKAEKLNVAALGNMVPQLHVHHIARFAADDAWPAPVWGAHPARPYSNEDLQLALANARQHLAALILPQT